MESTGLTGVSTHPAAFLQFNILFADGSNVWHLNNVQHVHWMCPWAFATAYFVKFAAPPVQGQSCAQVCVRGGGGLLYPELYVTTSSTLLYRINAHPLMRNFEAK